MTSWHVSHFLTLFIVPMLLLNLIRLAGDLCLQHGSTYVVLNIATGVRKILVIAAVTFPSDLTWEILIKKVPNTKVIIAFVILRLPYAIKYSSTPSYPTLFPFLNRSPRSLPPTEAPMSIKQSRDLVRPSTSSVDSCLHPCPQLGLAPSGPADPVMAWIASPGQLRCRIAQT